MVITAAAEAQVMLQQGHACARPCRTHIPQRVALRQELSPGSHVCEAALCFIQYGVRAIIGMLAATLGTEPSKRWPWQYRLSRASSYRIPAQGEMDFGKASHPSYTHELLSRIAWLTISSALASPPFLYYTHVVLLST